VRDVPIPPIDEQEMICGALTAIDNRKQTVSMEMQKLRSLKQGIMQDLLTGKVRVTTD
jgi:type I restriction enzyme S subunit